MWSCCTCCRHWSSLLRALYIVAPLAPALMLLIWLAAGLLPNMGVNPGVLGQALPFLNAMNWSTLPLLLYFAFRRYLQAVNLVKPITFALISANIVNLVGDWILIYGHLGSPAFGVAGAGGVHCRLPPCFVPPLVRGFGWGVEGP